MNGPRYRPRGERPLRRPLDSSRLRGPAADPSVEQRIRELDAEREPLSLAEEIASERGAGLRRDPVDGATNHNGHAKSELPTVAELQRMSVEELRSIADQENVAGAATMEKRELVFKILKTRLKNNGLMYGEGTLEILPDGFWFLAILRTSLSVVPR